MRVDPGFGALGRTVVGALFAFFSMALTLAPAPLHAGSICTLTIVGGNDQTVIPGSRLSRPLRVRYDANGTGPSSVDMRFFNCEGNNILLDPISPEVGEFDVTAAGVADGATVEMLGFVPVSGTPPSFTPVCVDVFEKDMSCIASIAFDFDVREFQLSSPDSNPTAPVGVPIQLEVQLDPQVSGERIVWEVAGGAGFLDANETLTQPNGSSQNTFTANVAGQVMVRAWIGSSTNPPDHPLRGAPVQLGLVNFVVGVTERNLDIIGGNNQSAPVNQQLPQPLSVQATITDQLGSSPEPGVDVEFFIKGDGSGGAQLVDHGSGSVLGNGTAAVLITDASGIAAPGLRMGPSPGPVLICFSDVEGQASGGCFDATALAGPPPALVIVSGNNQQVAPGATFAPLQIGTSPPGQIMPGTPANWQIISGNATVDGESATITEFDSFGNASVTVQAGQGPSNIVVRASTSGYDPVDFNLSIRDPIVQTLIEIAGNNQAALPGEVFDSPLVVQVLRDGVPVAGVPVRWQRIQGTGTIEPDGASQVVLTSGSDGQSSILARAPEQPGLTRIRADADGFGAVIFDLSASTDAQPPPGGGDVRLVIVSGNNQSGATGTASDEPIVVQLTHNDAETSPIVGQRIDWTVESGSATLAASSSITDASGNAAMPFTYGAPGAIAIRASVPSTDVSVVANASSFQPVLSIVSGDGQSGDVSTALALPLVVGTAPPGVSPKGLAGIQVTWTVVEGGGTLGNVTTLTGTDGTSSNTLILGSTPGSNRIRAAIAGSPPVEFVATAIAEIGVGVELSIVSGDNQRLPTNELSAPLVVEVLDGQGNPVPNIRLRWTAGTSGSIAVENEQTQTGVDGRSSNRVRALRPGENLIRVSFVDTNVASTVDFTLNAGIINTSGLGERERDIASSLDDVCARLLNISEPTPEQADLILICRGLIDSSGTRPGEVRDVLRELMPDEILSAGRMGLQMGAAQFDNLKARLAALRGGVSGVSFGGLALRGDNGTMPLGFLDTLLFGAAPDDEIGSDFSRWSFFLSGNFGRGEKRVTERETGFKFNSWSLTGGVDYRYSDTLVFGVAAGYNNNETDLRGSDGTLDSTGYSMSLYSTWYRQQSFYLDSVLTLGRNDFDLQRSISFTLTGPEGTTTYNQSARSKVDGNQLAFAISAGRDFTHDGWTFGPYVRATLARQKIDSFTETIVLPGLGSGLAFRVDERSLSSRSGVLGGKINYAKSTNWGILLPHFQIEYQREFQDDEQDVVVRLLHDPGATPFVLRGDPVDRNFLNIGLGLSAVFANGRSAFIFYERTSGLANQKRENIALGLRIEF